VFNTPYIQKTTNPLELQKFLWRLIRLQHHSEPSFRIVIGLTHTGTVWRPGVLEFLVMLLTELEARGFRNLRGNAVCGDGLNILLGDNGQGKTNWLEAIYLLATTRSFRTAKLSEAINFDEGLAVVVGKVFRSKDIRHELRVVLEGNAKAFSVNGKRETVSRYLGELHAVVFNADELEVVRGTPENRRRFLDESITAIHPPYVQTVTDYNRVIRQKNTLLQTARDREYSMDKTTDSLSPWNEQLAGLAAKVHRSRVRYVERLNEALEKDLFGDRQITIRYASSLEEKGDLGDYVALMKERLALRVQAELVAGHALIGTHRDDLEVLMEGREIRKYGSSGQQRSALLMLQLANIEIYTPSAAGTRCSCWTTSTRSWITTASASFSSISPERHRPSSPRRRNRSGSSSARAHD
jgi:DNA replication and repair protein RecF